MARKENDVYVVSDKLTISNYSLVGTLDNVIKELESVRRMATDMGMVGEGSLDISTECGGGYGGYYDNDYETVITYHFDRLENAKEKAIREKVEALERGRAAAKRKATAEKKKLKTDAEYAEFLRLKEKFGAL